MTSATFLYLFVEGEDDERFFKSIIMPKLKEIYDVIIPIPYAQDKKEKTDRYIKSIKSMKADYIYVTDMDKAQCIPSKKEEKSNKLKNIDKDKIIVVVKEIESWYLAGLDKEGSKKLKIKNFDTTNDITKEKFNALIKNPDERANFMVEILRHFDIKTAKQKNKSFKYFVTKYKLQA